MPDLEISNDQLKKRCITKNSDTDRLHKTIERVKRKHRRLIMLTITENANAVSAKLGKNTKWYQFLSNMQYISFTGEKFNFMKNSSNSSNTITHKFTDHLSTEL